MSTTKKKQWGNRSSWALSYFDILPSSLPAETKAETTTSTEASSSPSASPSPFSPNGQFANEKDRKRALNNPQTRYQCRRCHTVLVPPIDKATGKPRYGVMLCEHLEGVSSGGTTHLATGVSVCEAGTLRYDRGCSSAASMNVDEHITGNGIEEKKADGSGVSAHHGVELLSGGVGSKEREELDRGATAATDRMHVLNLLRQCQRAARRDGGSRAAVPLLFIVVENPKTPANAGGILRAMKCYGVRGPSTTSADATPPSPSTRKLETNNCPLTNETTRETARSSSPSRTECAPGEDVDERDNKNVVEDNDADGDDGNGVLQRVGAFIFSGTRLQKALAHTDFASTLRTDPTHAGRDIPQLCLPSLDILFDVLRAEFGHRPGGSSPTASAPVRVVAVELVEGATLLPAYTHPFQYCSSRKSNSRRAAASTEQPALDRKAEASVSASDVMDATRSASVVPMVFYVFGAEDGTLSEHHLAQHVDDVVFMPTTGSMNLAATVNVLLYDRIAKECCALQPAGTSAAAAAEAAEGGERERGQKWRSVFESRNANNRTRWTRPS